MYHQVPSLLLACGCSGSRVLCLLILRGLPFFQTECVWDASVSRRRPRSSSATQGSDQPAPCAGAVCSPEKPRHTSERSSQPSACLFAPLKPGTSSTSRKRNLTESGSCQLLIPACCCYCKLPGSAMTVQQRPLVPTLTSASVICQPWVKQWKTSPRTDLNDHEADCLAHRPSGFVISHAVSSNHSMLRQLCLSGFDPSSNWEFPT